MKSPKEKKYYKFQKFEYYNKGVSQTEEQQLENIEVNNFLSTLSITPNQYYLLEQTMLFINRAENTQKTEMMTAIPRIPENRYRFIISPRLK